jgi:HD-GYP domain-containing protein (c-di-GMP phosphodiesterase class II)
VDVKKFNFVLSKMDKEAQLHAERTAMLCYAVAKELDLETEEAGMAYMSGLLHEVGKCLLPEKINLVQEEVDSNLLVPYIAAAIVNSIEGFEPLAEILLQQMENVDGSGYPKGLKQQEIELIAIILRIAEFYDAQRAKGLTHDDTTKLLRLNSDVIFPRKIITPFIKSVIKNKLQFEYEESFNWDEIE